jgi:hypothetical protein
MSHDDLDENDIYDLLGPWVWTRFLRDVIHGPLEMPSNGQPMTKLTSGRAMASTSEPQRGRLVLLGLPNHHKGRKRGL